MNSSSHKQTNKYLIKLLSLYCSLITIIIMMNVLSTIFFLIKKKSHTHTRLIPTSVGHDNENVVGTVSVG